MRFLRTLLGFSAQLPLQDIIPSPNLLAPPTTTAMATPKKSTAFAFKEGPGVFSPKDMLELGRPGQPVPNEKGDLAFVSFSKYSFEDSVNKKSLFVVSLDSDAEPVQIPAESGETFWIGPKTLARASVSGDNTNIYAFSLDLSPNSSPASEQERKETLIGSIPSKTASNFKYNPRTSALVFSAYVYPDGNLSSVKDQDDIWEGRGNSALVYDETYVRHWDEWRGPKAAQLFTTTLKTVLEGNVEIWTINRDFRSPLKDTNHHTPVEPFGGTDDFDVSDTHILYTTKDPLLPEAWHTKQNIYIVPIDATSPPVELTSGKQGAVHSPVFSTDGKKCAWLELDKDGYESDRAKIVIYDLQKRVRFTITQEWDRSPDALVFSKDDKFIYFTAGDVARIKVFALAVPPTPSESTTSPKLDNKYRPVALTQSGAVSGLRTLPGGRLVFARSTLTSPNDVFVIEDLWAVEASILTGEHARVPADAVSASISVSVKQKTKFSEEGLKDVSLSAGEEFWFKGARDKDVHGWAIKPPGFKTGEKKKWPVILFIHGGPQGAWEDQWSTRWNPNVFAQQGYVVIAINPTGSTTFGQEFTDAIAGDWGGKPFVDLVKGWKHALQIYPEIDADRAVAAGASWGGYAINWIQSNPEFGFGFKALFCHDGLFDAVNGFNTDELFFFNQEWAGRPWEDNTRKLTEKFSPSNFVHKWSTPQLLVHGEKDYRLVVTEAISVFHALQQRGIPSRLVVFPDENHWVLKHGNSLKWHYEVLRWFDQFVGDSA